MQAVCTHLDQVRPVTPRTPDGCEDCLAAGRPWIHLRSCPTCGHVDCCDSSPKRRAHAHSVRHPIIRSFEPGEDWLTCFVDDVEL